MMSANDFVASGTSDQLMAGLIFSEVSNGPSAGILPNANFPGIGAPFAQLLSVISTEVVLFVVARGWGVELTDLAAANDE
jgi:hypothetical protein